MVSIRLAIVLAEVPEGIYSCGELFSKLQIYLADSALRWQVVKNIERCFILIPGKEQGAYSLRLENLILKKRHNAAEP